MGGQLSSILTLLMHLKSDLIRGVGWKEAI